MRCQPRQVPMWGAQIRERHQKKKIQKGEKEGSREGKEGSREGRKSGRKEDRCFIIKQKLSDTANSWKRGSEEGHNFLFDANLFFLMRQPPDTKDSCGMSANFMFY